MERKTTEELRMKEIREKGRDILKSDLFRKAREEKHHRSNVAAHSIGAAREALRIADFLQKMNIEVDRDLLIQCALCHDLGTLDRHQRYKSQLECCQRHPSDSLELYSRLVHEPSETEKDCILHHMWPVLPVGHPTTKEGIVLNLADKGSSIREMLSLKRNKTGK